MYVSAFAYMLAKACQWECLGTEQNISTGIFEEIQNVSR